MATRADQRRHKQIEQGLDVHAWTPGGFVRAGTLQMREEGDRQMMASFAYDPNYLEHPQAYPLDPRNLPLSDQEWETGSPLVTLGAIFDAAPDAWGRRVVRANLPPGATEMQVYREAFLRGADGIGSLLLTPVSARPPEGVPQDIDALVQWSLRERPRLSQLQEAAQAARLVEEGAELDENVRSLLAGSWTIGGARPKAIMADDRAGAPADSSVVVKFESLTSGGFRNRIEWVSLELAARAGLNVPEHALVDIDGPGHNAALVLQRFDRGWAIDGGGDPAGVRARALRRHYVSAASFVSAEPTSHRMDSARDRTYFSWKRLLDVTSAVTAKPAHAKVEMFARLAFNAALHNTDDHLKNFGFLKVHGHPVAYEVAPVFDVSPQAADGHYLWCGSAGRVFTLPQALACARELGIAKAAADQVADRILEAFDSRHELYEEAGLSERERQTAEVWFGMGCGEVLPELRRPAEFVRERG